ncbi:MAG: S8 family peptidase [Anaerolineae bacterium]
MLLVLLLLYSAASWPAQADRGPLTPAADPAGSAAYVPGQLLVKLPAVTAAAAEARIAQAGGRVLRTIPALGLALVEVGPGENLAAAAARLQAQAGTEWAEPNYIFQLDFLPNDPEYSRQSRYLDRIHMAQAWDFNFGRPEIVLAVLDTGVDMTHPDLASAIWVNAGEIPDNGVDDDGNGFVDDVNGWDFADNDNSPDDDHGHGTHVAGIAAATVNNRIGIAGVAGGVTIMPVDVFQGGIGTYEDLIRAIIYAADNGAHVINMSLGASSYSRGEEMAVDYAWSRGAVVVAAAGNTSRESYHYPAAHPNVIAVAATTADDYLASFSTRGEFVDVAAPGSSVYSTFRGGGYSYMSGTSMAAPHVSGLAALILSRNPGLTPAQVRSLIEATVDDLGPTGRDIYFGHGRINAERALIKTTPASGPPPPRPGPSLEVWPAGCQALIVDGDFEDGLGGWQVSGAVGVDATRAYSGTYAVHFAGGPEAGGTLARAVAIPARVSAGMLWFAYRIENLDRGWGTRPDWPFDDWLVAEFQAADGTPIQELLRTGNSADTASSGLPWDRFLYRISLADLEPLRAAGTVRLVFRFQNDQDTLPTDFWVDEVRFCVTQPYRYYYFPLWQNSGNGP